MTKKPQAPVPEVVTIEEMEAGVGAKPGDVKVEEMRPKEKAAFYIAVGLGIVITVVIFFVGIDWISAAPTLSLPSTDNLTSEKLENVEKLIEQYQTINGLAMDRAKELFDLIVVKSLLPIFTSLLGFLFGTQVVAKE